LARMLRASRASKAAKADGPDGRTVDIGRNSQVQEWLTVHLNGRLEHHVDRAAGVRSQWVGLDYVKNYCPQVVPEVEAALADLVAFGCTIAGPGQSRSPTRPSWPT